MRALLRYFARHADTLHTVVVMDAAGSRAPEQFTLRPRHLFGLWVASLVLVTLAAAAVVAFTPVRQFIPGYGTEEVRRSARLTALRVAALRDSLAVQRQYARQLQRLIVGGPDSLAAPTRPAAAPRAGRRAPARRSATPAPAPAADDWADHAQPALPVAQGPTRATPAGEPPRLQLPVLPPVDNGYLSRGFDARAGHFAIDLAVEEGSPVRAVGDGHVILADWTQDGGYAIAVQHADGYASVYKHNQRLLKRVGERVRARETIALSGNSGEITTGPHLHFELWRNGLAQDPRQFIVGL
jgi:murein DD-endopeptidase MepM/ murein hydrolase activator NlpD